MDVAPEIQSWGGGSNVEGKSLLCKLHFRSACKTKKNASAQGSLKFREVSNSFWEGTRREKTHLKEVSYLLTYLLTYLLSQLVSQNKIILLHVVVLCFLQVFRSSNYAYIIGIKGRLCHQCLAVFFLGQDMVMSQMSLYIELDRHS